MKKAGLIFLLACASAWADAPPLRVVASFYPMYVMTLNVVGDAPGVSVECLTEPATRCLHDYHFTPRNMATLARADVLVVHGAGMEPFLQKVERPSLKIVSAKAASPHGWVSIAGAISQTRKIAQGLAGADPARAEIYKKNSEAYAARLEFLRKKMHAILDEIPHRQIVTFHDAFADFAREFNLQVVAVIEREPGSEPNAGELAQTIRAIREKNVRALFAEPQYPARSARLIRRETGLPVYTLDPAATGPREPAQARDSYLKTMEANLKTLQEALK